MKGILENVKTYLAGSIWRMRILFTLLGAVGGYAYYYYVGCASGTCPISSNPYVSTIYGAGMGLILTIGNGKKMQQKT
jgi:hypothetical protein